MNCTSCNNKMEEGSRFCRHCGEKVAIIESSVQKDAEIVLQVPNKSADAKVSDSCIYCGQKIPPRVNYCRHCGHDLRSTEDVNNADIIQSVNNDGEINAEPRTTKSSKFVIAIIVIFIVFAGWGLSFLFQGGSASTSQIAKTPATLIPPPTPPKPIAPSLPYPLPAVKTGFVRTEIPGVGSIDIPSAMRIQPVEMTQWVTDEVKNKGMSYESRKTNFVLMQKEMQYYSRIMVTTDVIEEGTRLTEPIAEQSEFPEFNKYLRAQLEEGFAKSGGKILSWQSGEMSKLNGMHCIKNTYRYASANREVMQSSRYLFLNRDRTVWLTMVFRENEANIWQPLFEEMLRSFRITDIR